MARAKVQSIKEPSGLCRDGKRPDGASVLPWRRGRNATWDVTVAAASYVGDTAVKAGAAAEWAAAKKTEKYDELHRNYIFIPLACEVTGVWNIEAEEFFNDLGSRISCSTGEAHETSVLYQRLSISLQKGNAACIYRPDPNFDWLEWCHLAFTKPHYLMLPGMKCWGLKIITMIIIMETRFLFRTIRLACTREWMMSRAWDSSDGNHQIRLEI